MALPGLFKKILKIRIADCVHYAGFRYGIGTVNPYENYIVGLSLGRPLSKVRAEFIEFLKYYRPLHLGEALGIELGHNIPLWALPWRRHQVLSDEGWKDDVDKIPDIITYYCELGIPIWRIEEEFGWLEKAWLNLKEHGYRPRAFGFVTVFELAGRGESRFLVLDGNHRISAMVAMGLEVVEVSRAFWSKASRDNAASWPAVRAGRINEVDALRIFDSYFQKDRQIYKTSSPANLLKLTQFNTLDIATDTDLEKPESFIAT